MSFVQVYGYTTDNGGNVLKTRRELLTEQDILLMTTHIDEEEADTEAIDVFARQHPFDEAQIRCAAHTVQLAVNDFLKPSKKQTDGIREIVRKLRVDFKRDGLPQPPLSNITRYVMFF